MESWLFLRNSIIGGGGAIIYSFSAVFSSFEINCFLRIITFNAPLAIIETVNDIVRCPDPNTGIDQSEHAFCLHYFINFFFRQLGAMIKPIYESLAAHPIGGNSSMTSAFTRSSDSNSIDQPRSVILGNISNV